MFQEFLFMTFARLRDFHLNSFVKENNLVCIKNDKILGISRKKQVLCTANGFNLLMFNLIIKELLECLCSEFKKSLFQLPSVTIVTL